MRKSNTEPLKDVLQRYLRAIGAEQKLKEIRLLKQWEMIVGKQLAYDTQKVFIDKEILYVKFATPSVKANFLMVKTLMIKKINDIAEENLISDIRLL